MNGMQTHLSSPRRKHSDESLPELPGFREARGMSLLAFPIGLATLLVGNIAISRRVLNAGSVEVPAAVSDGPGSAE
jgi:hypothetical protein